MLFTSPKSRALLKPTFHCTSSTCTSYLYPTYIYLVRLIEHMWFFEHGSLLTWQPKQHFLSLLLSLPVNSNTAHLYPKMASALISHRLCSTRNLLTDLSAGSRFAFLQRVNPRNSLYNLVMSLLLQLLN